MKLTPTPLSPDLALHGVVAISQVLEVAGCLGDQVGVVRAKEVHHVIQVGLLWLGLETTG